MAVRLVFFTWEIVFMPFGVRSKSRLFVIAAILASVASAAIVQAAPADIAASKARQTKMRDMGGEFKAISDELKKRKPDWDNVIAPNAESVASRSGYLLNWFPKGSGPEAGVKTYSLPVIWQQRERFDKIGHAASAEAIKLNQLVAKRDLGGVKAQYVVLGKSCKACHDDYRSPDFEKDN